MIPYLEQTYSEPLQELDAWICQHGGVSIPLSKLAGDPRVTAKNGFIYIDKTDFGIPSAFHTLAEDVVKGESLIDTHIQFARGLHYGENYVEAMEILDKLLTTETDNLEAITLKAEIYGHEEKYDLALPLIERVLAVDKTIRNAWEILADICEFRCDWKGLLNATDYILDNFELSTTSAARLLLDHAHARKELGDIAGMEIDLEDVEAIEWTRQRPPYIQRRIDEIRDQPKDTDN